MSHELKAPLNAVLGFAAILEQGPLTDGQRESVGIIEQRGRELQYLIETILDTARAAAGELSLELEHTSFFRRFSMPATLLSTPQCSWTPRSRTEL
jgi:signal transduction histidine kinase